MRRGLIHLWDLGTVPEVNEDTWDEVLALFAMGSEDWNRQASSQLGVLLRLAHAGTDKAAAGLYAMAQDGDGSRFLGFRLSRDEANDLASGLRLSALAALIAQPGGAAKTSAVSELLDAALPAPPTEGRRVPQAGRSPITTIAAECRRRGVPELADLILTYSGRPLRRRRRLSRVRVLGCDAAGGFAGTLTVSYEKGELPLRWARSPGVIALPRDDAFEAAFKDASAWADSARLLPPSGTLWWDLERDDGCRLQAVRGDSVGGAVALALQMIFGRRSPGSQGVAITAAVRRDGSLAPVGGTGHKIRAALDSSRLALPVDAIICANSQGIWAHPNVVKVGTVDEAAARYRRLSVRSGSGRRRVTIVASLGVAVILIGADAGARLGDGKRGGRSLALFGIGSAVTAPRPTPASSVPGGVHNSASRLEAVKQFEAARGALEEARRLAVLPRSKRRGPASGKWPTQDPVEMLKLADERATLALAADAADREAWKLRAAIRYELGEYRQSKNDLLEAAKIQDVLNDLDVLFEKNKAAIRRFGDKGPPGIYRH